MSTAKASAEEDGVEDEDPDKNLRDANAQDDEPVDSVCAAESRAKVGLLKLERVQLKEQLEHKREIHKLELAHQKIELERRKSELIVERTLGQGRLRQGGMSNAVFDRVLPRIDQASDWNVFL